MPPVRTPSRYDVTRDELARLLEGQPRYRVDQVWAGLHEHLGEPDEWTNLPRGLRAELAGSPPRGADRGGRVGEPDAGDTVKFLWELDGGSRIESVLMLYRDRATVCVSTQAGCAMACGFCATGQAGFTRHLTQRRDRRAGGARHAAGPRGRTPRVERRVHGDGRTARQRGRGLGCGRAHPRRSRPVGASHHDQHRRRSCPGSVRSPHDRCRSTSP